MRDFYSRLITANLLWNMLKELLIHDEYNVCSCSLAFLSPAMVKLLSINLYQVSLL